MNGKIALGALGGIGLITTVSVASSRSGSSDPSWTKGIPSFSFLSENKAFMDDELKNQSSGFGYRYAGLLVSDIESNNNWWKWSYKNLEKDLKSNPASVSETFKAINTSPQVPNTVDSLKNWCNAVYETNTNLRETPSLFNNRSIWKYCSPIQKAPVSLEETYPEQTVGREIKKVLLDLNKNDRIWHYRNKFFTGIPEDKFGEEPDLLIFKEGRKSGRNIKDICSEIYTKPALDIHPDFFTFCSISQAPWGL